MAFSGYFIGIVGKKKECGVLSEPARPKNGGKYVFSVTEC